MNAWSQTSLYMLKSKQAWTIAGGWDTIHLSEYEKPFRDKEHGHAKWALLLVYYIDQKNVYSHELLIISKINFPYKYWICYGVKKLFHTSTEFVIIIIIKNNSAYKYTALKNYPPLPTLF